MTVRCRSRRALHSFPTRRSSDLFESHFDRFRPELKPNAWREQAHPGAGVWFDIGPHLFDQDAGARVDRKSTRLNSSHANISYAVFCLKKTKTTKEYVSRGHYFRV